MLFITQPPGSLQNSVGPAPQPCRGSALMSVSTAHYLKIDGGHTDKMEIWLKCSTDKPGLIYLKLQLMVTFVFCVKSQSG